MAKGVLYTYEIMPLNAHCLALLTGAALFPRRPGAKARTSPPRVPARPLSGPFDFVIAPVFEHELKKIRQELNLLLLVQPLVGCERRERANARWRLDRSVRVRVS